MKQHIKFAVKSGIFLAILLSILLYITQILLSKHYFNVDWPETSTCQNFYKMERDSIDVLFLGSSHCVSAFSPQEIYDNYGLRSFNLGGGQQSVLVSYFWLKEALRHQHPKAVILDTYMCFPFNMAEPLNSSEAAVRLAVDPMKWSSIKVEAVSAICKHDESQEASSYYNPLIRFHNRWSDLGETDFTFSEMGAHLEMKGYSLLANRCGNEAYQPFEAGNAGEAADMVPLMKEYLDKIVELCKKKGIALILVKTPSTSANVDRYNCVSAYAQAHQIEYYDFNEVSLYNEMGYQFSVDNHDRGHINYWGAQKISAKIAQILTGDRYQVPAIYDEQWETSRSFYTAVVRNAQLRYITDIVEYLEAIRQSTYTIFIAAMDEASNSINESIIEKMRQLGLSVDLTGKWRNSYYAVISQEGILEEVGTEALSAQGSFRDGRCIYNISSAGYECGNTCSINLNHTEYAKKQRGLNIVVYDNVYRKVVDTVCFDTYADSLDAKR